MTLDLIYPQQVNWSLVNAHIPLIFRLSIGTNISVKDVFVKVSVRTRSTEYAKYERITPQILPDKPWSVNNLTDRDFTVDFKKAATLSHSVPAILKVELQTDKTSYSTSGPLELLAYNEWHQAIEQLQFSNGRKQALSNADIESYHLHAELPPGGHISPSAIKKRWDGDPPLEAGVVSLVFANHPLFKEYVVDSQAQDFLRIVTGNPSATTLEYATGSPQERRELIQAVYMMLLEKYPAFYSREDPETYKITSQRVRFPDEILPIISRIRARIQKQVGTCIDFVLVFCAVLERLGLRPLIIITEHGDHAIAGCWMDDRSTFKGGIICRDKEEIKKLENEGKIFGIDITEYVKNEPYDAAVNKGNAYLDSPNTTGFCYAVDIQAARHADVQPLLLPSFNPLGYILFFLAGIATAVMGILVAIGVLAHRPLEPANVWELIASGKATMVGFAEEDFGEIRCKRESNALIIEYTLKKGYIGCAVNLERWTLDTSIYKSLIVNAVGEEKKFEIKLKRKVKGGFDTWESYEFTPSGQDIERSLPDIGKIDQITIEFNENTTGTGKGKISISKFVLSPKKRD